MRFLFSTLIVLLILLAIAYVYFYMFGDNFIREEVISIPGTLHSRFRAAVSKDCEEYYVKGIYNNHFVEVCSKELYDYMSDENDGCLVLYKVSRRSFLNRVLSDRVISVCMWEEFVVDVTRPHIVIEDLI